MSQSLLDFSGYIKFFVGLFALVNPVGILPVFISMTSYQAAAGRNKTNMTANLSVAIILSTALFLGDAILHLFGISIDSFRIAGGDPGGHHCDVYDQRETGRGQTEQAGKIRNSDT